MNATEIVNKVKICKGTNIPACWERTMKTRKDVPMHITKRTCAYVRAGINYANLARVKDGIGEGETVTHELPWGEWELFPFIIRHNDAQYIRLYPATFSNLKQTVEYFIDGAPATEEQVKPLCLASEFREREESPKCFTLKAESIVRIGLE